MEFMELHIKFYNSTEYIYAFIQFVQFIKLGNLKYSKLLKNKKIASIFTYYMCIWVTWFWAWFSEEIARKKNIKAILQVFPINKF